MARITAYLICRSIIFKIIGPFRLKTISALLILAWILLWERKKNKLTNSLRQCLLSLM